VRRSLAATALAVVITLGAVACGTGGHVSGGDPARGRQLFTQSCGSCHTMAAAGTSGTIGPNLDDAFGADRRQGFPDSSIQQIVADQIRLPLLPESCPSATSRPKGYKASCQEGSPVTPTGTPVMPANLVKGKDVDDVSAFVAKCAGNQADSACSPPGGGTITATDGKTIFQQAGCTGCHTLADAGSTGTIGPNLDQAKPPKSLVVDRVTNGKGGMPSFKDKLTDAQIQAVADYVSSTAGK
jgi:mono/diheme cytochrome c family protein